MSSLDSGRYSVAAGCVGICQGCLDASIRYSKERQQFGRPIASLPAGPGDARRHGARDRRRADARLARRLPEGQRASRTRPRPRSPSCTPPRPRSGARTPRSRSTAARATSTTIPVERYLRDARVDHPVRGHLADPEADHRTCLDRSQRARPCVSGASPAAHASASPARARWAPGSPSWPACPGRARCCTTRSRRRWSAGSSASAPSSTRGVERGRLSAPRRRRRPATASKPRRRSRTCATASS